VTGGKGGVGKTLIATNLAIGMARAGYRTLLVDLDPGLANIDVHLRLAPRYTIEDLADGSCSAQEAVFLAPGQVSVLCGRSGSTRLADDREFVDKALDAIQVAACDFDVVICDTGAGIGHAVLETARRSQQLLAVTTPEPAAITDTYALCKLFIMREMTTPRLLVNKVRSRDEAMRTVGRLSTVCRRFLGIDLDSIGWLHRDNMLEHSVRDQRPFALAGVGPAMEDLRALTAAALSGLPDIKRRGKGIKRQSLAKLRSSPR
jgi:flagellar biosynthesis protein FlhG